MIRNCFLRISLAVALVFLLVPTAYCQLSTNAGGGSTGPEFSLASPDGIVIVENIDGFRVAMIDPKQTDLTQELASLPRGTYYLVYPWNEDAKVEFYVD